MSSDYYNIRWRSYARLKKALTIAILCQSTPRHLELTAREVTGEWRPISRHKYRLHTSANYHNWTAWKSSRGLYRVPAKAKCCARFSSVRSIQLTFMPCKASGRSVHTIRRTSLVVKVSKRRRLILTQRFAHMILICLKALGTRHQASFSLSQ